MAMSYTSMYFATLPRAMADPFTLQTGAFPPYVLDLEGNRRSATLKDVRDSIRLADALENIDLVGPPCSAQEIPAEVRPVVVAAEMAKNTSKPGSVELWSTTQLKYVLEIAAVVQGGDDELRRRPILVGYSGIRSPLCLDSNMAAVFIEYVNRGIPQWLYSMPCGGTTAPATMLGVLTQGIAETLVGLVLGYAITPQAVVSIDMVGSLAEMATGGFPYSGPDVIALQGAANQMMTQFYGRPGGAHGGRTDACFTGVQAGIEKGLSMIVPLLAGARGIGTVGQVEKNLTFSYQQLVVDDEIARYIKQILKGVRGDPSLRALEVIEEVGPGGTFVDHPHTAEHFREEFWFSPLMERVAWGAWEGQEIRGMEARALEKAKRIVAEHHAEPLDDIKVKEIDRIVASADRELVP
jgi:trimethylamine--corrinoid protein Co-methyltransferase